MLTILVRVSSVQLLPQISGRAARAKLAGIASLRSNAMLFIFCTISWFYTAKKGTILTNMDDEISPYTPRRTA